MSVLLTKAFEKWVAECTASNLPARPDTIIFALMEREPTREDNTVPEEKITYTVNELTYGQLSPNNIVCSAVVPDDCAFSYDWICLIHQASGTLCGVIKTPVRQKVTGESLIRNFTIIYSGIAQAAQITVPPQSWQIDLYPELKSMLKIPNRLSEIAAEGKEAQQESRDNLGLKTAATMNAQTDLYDSTEGRVALPGAFGYGMTDAGARSIIASNIADIARTAHNLHPGRYYTFSTQTEETTGITEIIWLDNGWGDKTSQTATKLVLFFGKDGRILMTVRGDNITAPVTWTNLTPQLGNAAQKDAQENIYDRTEGRLAIPGMFGFGKIFSSSDRIEFKSGTDFLRWVKTAKPGRYTVFADTNVVVPGIQTNGVIEIIWPQPKTGPNDEYVYKVIIYYGVNGHIYYNRCAVSLDGGFLVGWENLKVDEASLIAKIEARAPLKSPALTGTPSTPTPPDDAAGTEIANAEFVRKLLAALVDSSPEALDTLNELAAALGNDPNFATTVTNALAGKQPLSDVLTAISKLKAQADNLLYFNTDGKASLAQVTQKARSLLAQATAEDMRKVLELEAPGTVTLQSDIYDRSEGRGALPGAFGYGAFYSTPHLLTGKDGPMDFLMWVMETPPGRYLVTQVITDPEAIRVIPGLVFDGVVEIESPYSSANANSHSVYDKVITYRGARGELYYNRLIADPACPQLEGWWSPATQIDLLRSVTGNAWGSPGVGGLIFAAYFGESDTDSSRKMKRGQVVPGSRLGTVTISAKCSTSGSYASTPQFITVSPNSYPQAGSFIALSGSHLTTLGTSECFVGLFMRVN
ncbi:TPA: phage tail protein [Escherichia coli]|uniref:phage tail-collar fiber domain-containing protein n=1 Tax=Escherichia coli TaxID=562 RepID=UPI003B5E6F63|nr:phage tail protein [Escherichia coli]